MKRLFISMGLFLWLAIGGIVIVGAESYPVYLNGDRNYILCDAYKETAWYLDRSSLNVQKYDPPQYIIAVNVVTVPDMRIEGGRILTESGLFASFIITN